jgi:hypothetical protein
MKIRYSTRNAMQSEHAMITWNCKEPDQRLRASFGTLQGSAAPPPEATWPSVPATQELRPGAPLYTAALVGSDAPTRSKPLVACAT